MVKNRLSKLIAAGILAACVMTSQVMASGIQGGTSAGEQGQAGKELPVAGGGQLDSLLAAGVISQETYDTIQTYMAANMKSPEEEGKAQGPGGGPPERSDLAKGQAPQQETNWKENGRRNHPVYAIMVENGIIPETLMEAINTYLEANRVAELSDLTEANLKEQGAEPRGRMAEELNELLTAGIIDSETHGRMLSFTEKNAGLMEKGPGGQMDLFDMLLEEGVLTSAQHTAIDTYIRNTVKQP